ncbi:MAG: hypothetical protein COU07_03780 [Candidatus Harrisonbacteria bacterium CG10_big_fil_rev_8_21_14_0_10_40_38]|uniref:Peptidase S59 domain-containing protein n=1 Tax=Candidatus Harrisonbacteria bacterium CG10_big_fil_rev_8_21_14_0_10_40_38 TaxID=1974583 RepID=A0A2H0URB1_9BACT|nr:MAG: hypothetical protein COU07_03780 [Candidatus Harrisonbacteria bacterium CG10_big_fil_rev_8_21_14_0_10_40_38]
MQQFQVPQFIDMSPKIVGPLTLKQFLILAAAGIPVFILLFVFKPWLWAIIAVIAGGIAAAFAFAKINGQPLSKIAVSAFIYLWKPRLYLWKRIEKQISLPELPKIQTPEGKKAPLKDLFLKITTTTHPIEQREKLSKLFTLPKFTPIKKSDKPKPPSFETIRRLSGERDEAKRVDY